MRLRFDCTIVCSDELFLTDSEGVGKIGSKSEGVEGTGIISLAVAKDPNVRSSNNKSSAVISGNTRSIFCTTSKLGLLRPDRICDILLRGIPNLSANCDALSCLRLINNSIFSLKFIIGFCKQISLQK